MGREDGAGSPINHQYRSVQDLVVTELREQILSGRLRAGQRLVVRDLTDQLQVSATPVRLALAQLASEGFVRAISHHRSVEVCRITPEEVEELYLMRIELEQLAVRLGAQKKTTEDMDRLRRAAERYLEVFQGRDSLDVLRVYDTFRMNLFETCRRQRLIKTINELRLGSERYRRIYYQYADGLIYPRSTEERAQVVQRILTDFAAGQTEWIEEEIERGHMRAAKLIIKVVSENKGF